MILIKEIFNETIAYPELTPFIDEYLEYTHMDVIVKGKHIDLEDIENPIKPYSEVYFQTRLSKLEFRSYLTKISRQEVALEDNFWFSLTSPDPILFNRFSESSSIFQGGRNLHLSDTQKLVVPTPVIISISIDHNIYQHKRKVRD